MFGWMKSLFNYLVSTARMGWAGHVALMGEIRHEYTILIEKS
jgi:hypothetical protein